ncbi:hypothetical protein EST38_g5080 [Candolleomyces aberdarensis]|uniref:Uncharacterized protein n=1 Tax=Candolleomyces aberdarensis TaxID=2316362 RepID=A0A4Q2DLF3_9AGAR|nr:hypothetical protein EST38_g5080 [Candolleomyces aberdarensis]
MSTYTASSVFLKTLVDAGITHAFVNWGSDHPALLADLERQRAASSKSDGAATTRPEIVTCPNEMVALSSAQGFAQATGKPAAVIVHVDVGTQSLAGAVHNVDRNRCPVVIYAGASPFSAHGEHKGGRNEWIMWMQDIPDQSSVVRQYMRHVAQLNSARTIPGTVRRAIQVATSEPKGPVYIWARREVMEEDISPSLFDNPPLSKPLKIWPTLSPSALAPSTASLIAHALVSAERPLIITSHLGRNPNAVKALVELSSLAVIPALQVCPTVVSVPSSHPFGLGTTFLTPRPPGTPEAEEDVDDPYHHLSTADTILVIDSELPWIPSIPYQRPSLGARIFVMDGGDPLKTTMKMSMGGGGIGEAEVVVRADAEVGLGQIVEAAKGLLGKDVGGEETSQEAREQRAERLRRGHARRLAEQDQTGASFPSSASPSSPSTLSSRSRITYTVPALLTTLRKSIERLTTYRGKRTLVLNESITNFPLVWEYMRPESPIGGEGGLSMISSGGSSLGWALGGAVGASLGGRSNGAGEEGIFDLIVVIVGDGSFMFGVPSSVYWMARRYETPFLTIILNNGGWRAPKLSMLSVHPTLQLSQSPDSSNYQFDNNGQTANGNVGGTAEYALANIPGDRLTTGFGPHPPDYVGIAKAASAGWVWGTKVGGDVSAKTPTAATTNSTMDGETERLVGENGECAETNWDGGKVVLERAIEEGIRKVLEEKRIRSSASNLPISSPPFHFGSDTTHSSRGGSMVGIQPDGYGSDDHAVWASGPSDSQSTASSMQLAQLTINAQGHDGNDPRSVYNMGGSNTYSSDTEGIIEDQAYERSDITYPVGGYGYDGPDAGVIPYPSMSQVAVTSSVAALQTFRGDFGPQNMPVYDVYPSDSAAAQSQLTTNASTSTLQLSQCNSPYDSLHASQGPDGFERRHHDLPYGPIPHASIQSSNSMRFRTQRRTVNHRSAPYPVVYHQERSQGSIYNGPIHGNVQNVQNLQISKNHVGILQYLKEHAATGAMHDSEKQFPPRLCHPGTREAVIYRILDWYGYQARPDKPIMWVYAPAGYGKTAIAGTVSEKLEEKLRELNFTPLGATFFFWRTSNERNSPARFIITLTYQVFISIPELAPHIENAVKRNPMILTKTLETQLKRLIIEPFEALGDTTDMPNRLIIIDGLDECINSDRESRVDKKYAEDQETVQLRVLDLIYSLASHQLPLSFLILSRPEPWIKQHIESAPFEDLVEHVDLYEVGDHMKDVETFVRAELSRLGLDEEGLVTALVRRANGHMLYASTVIRHIDCPYDDRRKRLENILNDYSNSNPDLAHSTPFSSLNELYRQILRSCPEGNRSAMIDVLEEIGAQASCLDVGVGIHQAISVFDHIVGRVPGAGMKAIRGLHAVLRSQYAEDDVMDTFFIHRSFYQFLCDPYSSQEFHINREKGNRRLLLGCLHSMSFVTLHSKPKEDRVRFALGSWAQLFSLWSGRLRPDTTEYCIDVVEMAQKLLDINLVACFVHTFTLDFAFRWRNRPSLRLCNDDSSNRLLYAHPEVYELNTVVKRAISHVVASHKAAILHVLQRHTLTANEWCAYFPKAVHEHLWMLSSRRDGWNSDSVVHALKTLQQASLDNFENLMAAVEEESQSLRRTEYDAERWSYCYCTLVALIQGNVCVGLKAFHITR